MFFMGAFVHLLNKKWILCTSLCDLWSAQLIWMVNHEVLVQGTQSHHLLLHFSHNIPHPRRSPKTAPPLPLWSSKLPLKLCGGHLGRYQNIKTEIINISLGHWIMARLSVQGATLRDFHLSKQRNEKWWGAFLSSFITGPGMITGWKICRSS